MAPLPAWPVNFACTNALTQPTPMDALREVAGLMYNGTSGTLSCFDIEAEFVECADQSGCGTGPAGTAWDYQVCSVCSVHCLGNHALQACTELIWFMNTNNVTDMCGECMAMPRAHDCCRFPPRNWTEKDLFPYCAKVYNVVPNPEWLLQEYGAGNISTSASNIIFSNGLLDPWHVGGFLSNLSDSLPAVVIAVGVRHASARG